MGQREYSSTCTLEYKYVIRGTGTSFLLPQDTPSTGTSTSTWFVYDIGTSNRNENVPNMIYEHLSTGSRCQYDVLGNYPVQE